MVSDMQVQLLKCLDDNRVINKSKITGIKNVDCSVYSACDMVEPNLLISYFRGLEQVNYAYVPEWNRYYYVVNYTFLDGVRCVINMRCDVLMSFKPDILNVRAYILRSSEQGNEYLADSQILMNSSVYVHNLPFSETPFGQGNYILTVLGG